MGTKMVTSTLEPIVSIFTSDGNIWKMKKDHKEAVFVSKWNWENDIFATGGIEKKILVSFESDIISCGIKRENY